METKKIDNFIKNCNQVKLYYFNEEINCQILKQSKNLILVRDIKDWHFDAYMVFPKKYVKKIKYGKIEKCREKILSPLKKSQFKYEVSRINLYSIKTVLETLYKLNQGICIENANKNNYMFNLGFIEKIKSNSIKLKTIDICGKFNKRPIKIKYKDITCIFYKDEYSKKLIEYTNKRMGG